MVPLRLVLLTLQALARADTSGTVGHRQPQPPLMASFFTAALKNFKGGEEEPPKGPPKDAKEAAQPSGMNREEFEEYQRQLLEEK